MIIKKGYRHDLITFFISTDELMTAMQVNYSIAFFSTSQHKKLADLKCNLIGVSFFKSVSGIISRTVMAIRVSWFSEEIPIIQEPATTCWVWSIHPLIIWLRIIGVDLPDTSTPSTQRNRWHISVYSRAFCFCQINILRYLFNTGLQVFL